MSVDRPVPERTHVVTSGTFAAVPQGFEGGEGSLRYVIKPEFQSVPAPGDAGRVLFAVPRGHALLDLAAVNLADLDRFALARDCELVAAAVRDHFDDLLRVVAAFGPHGTTEQQAEALEIAERLKLTESAAAKAGGGLLGMVVIVGACLFASCFASCPPPKGGETTPPDK
ncbi:hypothetical protein [Nannocystis punicea]|uniref:Uncharacterized protein n=1 Tax=Nannocystis punicea TaxID=2995304 RepID=A0ABY7HDN9_9BACT|nr:hypothetical protein [Nannocystis poenicansa]WAS97217.1 hypothetical protein O0S08_13800 [Nannocystis poenicansa]